MEELLCLCMEGRVGCRAGHYYRTDAAEAKQMGMDSPEGWDGR